MNTPEWARPAIYGVMAGAVAATFIGFTFGGWVTGGTAQQMSASASADALVTALVPYCMANAQNDPRSTELMAELQAASASSRRAVIEKAGWATPIGAERPNRALAQACQIALASS